MIPTGSRTCFWHQLTVITIPRLYLTANAENKADVKIKFQMQ